MQPSSPTYASACHSRPFPLSSGLKVHMGTLPSSLHPSKSPLPSPWIPPSLWSAPSASRLSLPACSVSLCAALVFGGAARNAFALPCLSACSFRCVSLRFLQPGMWERGKRVHGFGSEQGFAPRSRWVGSSCSGSGNFCSTCAESGVRDAKRAFPGQDKEGRERKRG